MGGGVASFSSVVTNRRPVLLARDTMATAWGASPGHCWREPTVSASYQFRSSREGLQRSGWAYRGPVFSAQRLGFRHIPLSSWAPREP